MPRAPLYSSEPDELFRADAIDDPHPLYARLRARHPLARVAETGVHLVATWDLIAEALEREHDFSANLTGVLMLGDDGAPTTFVLPDNAASRVIATADEPDHGVHRAITQPRLSAGRIAEMEARVRDWVGEAIGAWIADGGGDVVPIAELIPARVVAHLLGLPDEDVRRHRTWAMMGGDILAGAIGQERLATLAVETIAMGTYLQEHFERARAAPRPEVDAPLLHALARGVDDERIGVDEAIGIAAVMFGAGGESTAALIGSAVLRLASDPELAGTLRHDPALIPRFVEEVVRLEPPFKFHYRSVRTECALGGYALRPGDRLMLLWASANRDPAHVEDPERFRLDRPHPRQHLGFGRGAHFCIGAPLARLEARIVCEELLTRTDRLAIPATAAPVWARSIFIRRLERLPLTVDAAR